jgi:hypothetical protein
LNTANANITYLYAVNDSQNTTIGTKFNSSGGTISGSVIIQQNLTVQGNVSYTGNVTSVTITGNTGQFFGYASNGFNALYAGIPSGYLLEPQIVAQISSNFDGYSGLNMQNINSGPNASFDLFLTADNGTALDGYVDLGIASSTYNYPGYSLIGKNDGYLFTSGNTTTGGGNMIIGTEKNNDIIFTTGGLNTENVVMRIVGAAGANAVKILSNIRSTSVTTGALQINGGLGVTGNIYAGNVYSAGSLVLTSEPIGVSAASNTVYLQGALNSANANILSIFAIDSYQNTNITNANTKAQAAFDKANTANTLAQAAFDVANTSSSNTIYLQGALNSANANITLLQGGLGSANANIAILQGGLNTANANISYLYAINTLQNNNITVVQGGLDTANANIAYLYAINTLQNNNITIVQGGLNSANANISLLQGGLGSANANITAIFGIDNYQNNNITIVQGGLNTANANITYLYAVNTLQNTNISSANTTAQAAFDKANTANTLAQAAFDVANTSSSNTIYLQGALNSANANIVILQGGLNSANANISYLYAINALQNTNISNANTTAQAAFDKANTGTSNPSTIIYANTGQLTANVSTGNVALGLANVNNNIGTFGGITATPVITIDGYGRVTSASNVATSGTSSSTITVLDDISNRFDGIERTFGLYSDDYAANVTAPEQLLVHVGGLVLPPFINTYDVVFGSGFIAFTKGYNVANVSNVTYITFASAPQINMDCVMRIIGQNQTPQVKKYPLSPISIMTGY